MYPFASGAYGVMVNTEVCGSSDTGSTPVRHPNFETSNNK